MSRAYASLAGDQPDPDLAVVAAQLGRFLALGGRYAEATPLLEEALELAEHQELPEVFSQALSSKTIILTWSDRLEEAGVLVRKALEVALEHGLTAAAQRAYNNLGVVLESQDRFPESAALCDQQLELYRRVGDRRSELVTLTSFLATLVALGRWDEALSRGEEAKGAEELASLEFAAAQLLPVGAVHVHRGNLGEARLLLESMRWAETSEDWQFRCQYARARAEVLRAEDQVAEALAAAEEALATSADLRHRLTNMSVKRALVQVVETALDLRDMGRARELLGMVEAAQPGQVTPWLRAQAARLSARAAAADGDQEAVEAGFETAEAGFREIRTPFDLAVALSEHAEWLLGRGRQDRAGPLRAEAREIFESLQARPWLERLGPLVAEASVPA
jgi:tetratricopeptide (TPR) repeat protein